MPIKLLKHKIYSVKQLKYVGTHIMTAIPKLQSLIFNIQLKTSYSGFEKMNAA